MSTTDDLKRLAEAATPGPWYWWMSEKPPFALGSSATNEVDIGITVKSIPDAEFVASANPKVVLELLASNRAKDERIEKLRAAHHKIVEYYKQHDNYGAWGQSVSQGALDGDDAAQRKG